MRKIVVTGAQGEIATAILRRLRKEYEVDAVERGDDLLQHVRTASAVVVLDGTIVGGPDQRRVLEAVADAVTHSDVRRIVSVTLVPHAEKERKHLLERVEAVERQLISGGYPLTSICAGLIVGTPRQPAPADAELFASGNELAMPGTGDQRVRPLLVDDLAELVVAALKAKSPPDTIGVDGPEDLSMRALLEKLNPGKDLRTHHVPWEVVGIAAAVLVVLLVFLRGTSGADLWMATLVILFPVQIVAFAMADATSLLPTNNLTVCDEQRKAPLGVRLRKVGDVWDSQALQQRAQKRNVAGSARKYATKKAVWWIAPFLLVFGAGAFIVGGHDILFTPRSGLGARLAGMTLAIAGATMVLGGIALLMPWRSRYALGFLGSVTCVVVVLVLGLAAAAGGDPPAWTLLVGINVLLAAGWSCKELWRKGGLVVGSVLATRGLKVLGSVIVGGTVATLLQVLYSSVYIPATATPSLTRQATITPAGDSGITTGGLKDRRIALAASVKLNNPSSHPVVALGASYVVHVRKAAAVTPLEGGQVQKWAPGERDREYSREVERELVERGDVLPPGTPFEPGEDVNKRFVVLAPPGYTVATLRVDVAVARRRYRRQDDVKTTFPGNGVRHSVTRIDDPAWLHWITRSPRYVHVVHATGRQLGCPNGARMAVYVDAHARRNPERMCSEPTRVDEHYGVTVQSVSAETRLPQPTSQPEPVNAPAAR